MKTPKMATLSIIPFFLVGCGDQATNDSDVAQGNGDEVAAPPPCVSVGGTGVELLIDVGQEYYDFEQTKNAAYFTSNSPADAATDFAGQYCSANPLPAAWNTPPDEQMVDQDGNTIDRQYHTVSCQKYGPSIPSPIPVPGPGNSQQIHYGACMIEEIGKPPQS